MRVNVHRWASLSEAERRALCRRAEAGLEKVLPAVERIIAAVRERGTPRCGTARASTTART